MLDMCDANRLDLLSFKTIFPEAAFLMNHSKLQIYKNTQKSVLLILYELFDIFSLKFLTHWVWVRQPGRRPQYLCNSTTINFFMHKRAIVDIH